MIEHSGLNILIGKGEGECNTLRVKMNEPSQEWMGDMITCAKVCLDVMIVSSPVI